MSNSIRDLLGITQQDMALLLRVSRSQLSLFELGKRSLPADAMIKLSAILSHIKKATSETNVVLPENEMEVKKMKRSIEELLFLNKKKQMVLDKSTKAILKKQQNMEAALKLAAYLKNTSDAFDLHLYKEIEARSSIKNDSKSKEQLFKNQLNKEMLLLEQKFLEDFMKKKES